MQGRRSDSHIDIIGLAVAAEGEERGPADEDKIVAKVLREEGEMVRWCRKEWRSSQHMSSFYKANHTIPRPVALIRVDLGRTLSS